MSAPSDDTDQQIEELRAEVATLRLELREALAPLVQYLKEEQKAARQKQGRLDRAIGGLESEESSP